MTFLNPLVLLGLAAAAIPLAVHLFNFRRPRRVDFSSLAFVKAMEEKAMRRLRLRQWLLLALRTAAVLLLVLAFAQPVYTSAWADALGEGAATSLAVVLDNSLSMTARNADGGLLEQARAVATEAIARGGAGDERAVLPTAPPVGYRPVLYSVAGPALDAAEALEPQAGAQPLSAAIARAASVLEGAAHVRREILVLSDLQASTFAAEGSAAVPEGIGLTLVPFVPRVAANTAITDVRIESGRIEPGRPVQIAATVRRWGGRAGSVALTLSLDGERVAEGAAEVAPGREATVRFAVTPRSRDWLTGEVRIEPDGTPWDDVRFFALRVPPAPRVLVVRGDGQRADLVTLALSVGAEAGALTLSETGEAALPGADLAAYDAVFLVGPQTLPAGVVAGLVRFVEGGGGLVLSPHDAPDEAAYARLFGALGGGSFGGAVDGMPRITTEADLEHPLFAGLLDPAEVRPRLEEVRADRAYRYVPGAGDESTLIQMEGGVPFLHEVRRASGRLLWLAAAPDEAWSDLPTRGLFAPLLYRAAGYLAGGGRGGTDAGLTVRRAGSVRVEGAEAGVPLRLVAPGGEATVPAQRVVDGGVVLDLDDGIAEPGVYAVMQGERVLRRVAFNESALESDPEVLSAAEAARRLEALTGRPVRVLDRASPGVDGPAAGRRTAPWQVLLALALGCLVAETLVAMRWKPALTAA